MTSGRIARIGRRPTRPQADADQQATARYTGHLDTVLALTTYLALTPKRSRTAANLADDLSLPRDDVRSAFEAFPSLFRKSRRPSPGGQPYYTLTARYALRGSEDEDGPDPELQVDVLKILLDLVSQRAEAEAAQIQFRQSLRQARINTRIAAVAAVIAAVASIVAASLSH
jgi:hypothetical protein